VPVALRREIEIPALCAENPCDIVYILGSFWPNSKSSYESHLVKGFKECCPVADFRPHIMQLCEFYAGRALEKLEGWKFDWVARVLASTETSPDDTRSMALLAEVLCRRLAVRDLTHLFYKSESRPSMRRVERLSGPESLDRRVGYVLQDLFIKPARMGGTVLLVDDILNTGASMRVYAHALKHFAGVERVIGLNLAATRFHQGKDGLGRLNLDTTPIEPLPGFDTLSLDKNHVSHALATCPSLTKPLTPTLRFLAEKRASPCPACCEAPKQKRKWWKVFG